MVEKALTKYRNHYYSILKCVMEQESNLRAPLKKSGGTYLDCLRECLAIILQKAAEGEETSLLILRPCMDDDDVPHVGTPLARLSYSGQNSLVCHYYRGAAVG